MSFSSPAKKTFSPMSRSMREVEVSMSRIVILRRGVGMNLRPRPSKRCAWSGRQLFVVRSWKASFFSGGKRLLAVLLARIC